MQEMMFSGSRVLWTEEDSRIVDLGLYRERLEEGWSRSGALEAASLPADAAVRRPRRRHRRGGSVLLRTIRDWGGWALDVLTSACLAMTALAVLLYMAAA